MTDDGRGVDINGKTNDRLQFQNSRIMSACRRLLGSDVCVYAKHFRNVLYY